MVFTMVFGINDGIMKVGYMPIHILLTLHHVQNIQGRHFLLGYHI